MAEPGKPDDGAPGDPGETPGTGTPAPSPAPPVPDPPVPDPPIPEPVDAVANIPLTIGSVSRLLGVAASTLRTWDRRYSLGPSERTDGQHRRYSHVDVARLALVRQLTLRGAQPAEAARAALATPASALTVQGRRPAGPAADPADPPASTPGALTDPVPDVAEDLRDAGDGVAPDMDRTGWPPRPGGHQRTDPPLTVVPVLVESVLVESVLVESGLDALLDGLAPTPSPPAVTGPGMVPGDFVEAPADDPGATEPAEARRRARRRSAPLRLGRVSAQTRGLARAVLAMDAPLMTDVLTDGVDRLGVVPTWDSIVSPVLVAVGRRWELTGDGIEIEHLFSETVLSVLTHRAAGLAAPTTNSRPVLLATTAGEMHSLTLYAIAAAMAERRVSARVLGSRVPRRALAAAVARVVPSAVFLWAQSVTTAHVDPSDLLGTEPTPGLVVGGPGWDAAAPPTGALYAGTLTRAVDLLCALAV